MAIFEESVRKNKEAKEKELQKQKLYAKNRADIHERMRKIKEFIKQKKEDNKINEEFFEENKDYFKLFDVKNYSELDKLIKDYDNMDSDDSDEESEESKKSKESKESEKNENILIVEHEAKNDLEIKPQIKKYKNLNLDLEVNNLHISNSNNYFTILEECKNINEYNFTADKKVYINNKMKEYEVNSLDNGEITGIKKTRYNNESELSEFSNINNFEYEKKEKNLISETESISQNGLSIDELRNRKIKKILEQLSEEDKKNYEKVESRINDMKNENKSYEILKNIFCINCNQCFMQENGNEHTGHYTLHIDENINNNNFDDELNINDEKIDFNDNLNKIYDHLKKEQNKILKGGNYKLIKYYGKLLYNLYDIIINNNSLEELNISIIKINEDYKKEIESETFCQYFKDYFLYYVQKITKITYYKEKKMEKLLADIDDENKDLKIEINDENENKYFDKTEKGANHDEDLDDKLNQVLSTKMSGNIGKIKNNFENYSENDKKKYFLKIGLELKCKYGKKESISDLFSKAKEQNIEPSNYEDFLMKELKILNTQN